MRIAKWIIVGLFAVTLGALIHYTLPRHDTVRIVGVETRLETFGINRFFYANAPSGSAETDSRDVRYIETLRPSGGERIFRNEDTGWGWPPYFKMNSADLQARARDLVSTSETPQWVQVTYYGIRSRMLSIYPNALRVVPVSGPEVSAFPWARTIALAVLAVLTLVLWVVLRRFRLRRVDPFLARAGERGTAARGWLRERWGRLTGRG